MRILLCSTRILDVLGLVVVAAVAGCGGGATTLIYPSTLAPVGPPRPVRVAILTEAGVVMPPPASQQTGAQKSDDEKMKEWGQKVAQQRLHGVDMDEILHRSPVTTDALLRSLKNQLDAFALFAAVELVDSAATVDMTKYDLIIEGKRDVWRPQRTFGSYVATVTSFFLKAITTFVFMPDFDMRYRHYTLEMTLRLRETGTRDLLLEQAYVRRTGGGWRVGGSIGASLREDHLSDEEQIDLALPVVKECFEDFCRKMNEKLLPAGDAYWVDLPRRNWGAQLAFHLEYPAGPTTIDREELPLVGKVAGPYPIVELRCTVNNKRECLLPEEVRPLLGKSDSIDLKSLLVPLDIGKTNVVSLWAKDTQGNTAQKAVAVTVPPGIAPEPAPAPPPRPEPKPQPGGPAQCWAVLVGLSEYKNVAQNGLSNLAFADDDARAMAATLRRAGWSESHMNILVDEQATKENIEYALEDWLTKSGENDLILLFWSGHGFVDPADSQRIYFACYDTDVSRPSSGYRMDRVREALREKRARNVIVIADTCNAGALYAARAAGDRAVGVAFLEQQKQNVPKGWIYMVGARTDQKALEHPSFSNGAFTHFLVKALGGEADGYQSIGPRDGVVTMGEVRGYMQAEMPSETLPLLGVAIHPSIETSSGDPDIWNLALQGR